MTTLCPCGSGKEFGQCCAPFLNGGEIAPDAEALMRSRYTAYALSDEAYLRATWDARTCPVERIVHDEPTQWLGLEVKQYMLDAGNTDNATVEFVARYKIAGRAHRLHEVSRFLREDGKWFYVDGSFPTKDDKKRKYK
ncbi:SEC-C domain-containing protein [Undibacterium sp. Jales W-56]|uniref:YchJ family protein n=1 Tax=Undibacterium sp. Jales W-56 TaxID=2897325 RepID=UPI0021CE6357|nr:YchJ family metal-binding protein [Undibacterium sp. Jales W-56]MCU6434830.1 SEC-C domain-containing protein [Undibacterium sp. Jales W-56]